jgi:hydroxysqualene dehydroxylase
LPFPMQGHRGGIAQWFFDRGALCGTPGVVAAVISSSGIHETMDHDDIAAAVHRELQSQAGALSPPEWHKVIAEKFATFACVPGLARPEARTTLPGLYLAGDYTQGDYPSTLEGAVRSGTAAARLAAEYLAIKKQA